MKVEVIKVEPVIKLELSVEEFNQLRLGFGSSNSDSREKNAKILGVTLDPNFSSVSFWQRLTAISI